MRESDFSGSSFTGAYLEKAVAYKANFTGTFPYLLSSQKIVFTHIAIYVLIKQLTTY